MVKYQIKCPYCGNNQYYKPRKKVPKNPHTKCSECKKEFAFKIISAKETIIENNTESSKKTYTKIDDKTIEIILLEIANNGKIDSSLVKSMIDYYIKIKEGGDVMEDVIDMERFLKVDINREKEDSQAV